MASPVETVRKANFQPHVALAVAEAIDNAMRNAQFVTVPVLDARFAELKAMIEVSNERLLKEIVATSERTRADVARWVLLAMLGSVAMATVASEAMRAIHQDR